MGANAQTEVPTFTANQILTAAQMNNSARTGVPVFASTTTRDAGFGGAGEKTLAEGQLAYIEALDVVQYYDGANWRTLGPGASPGLVMIRSKTSFTNVASVSLAADTFTSTYDSYRIVLVLQGTANLTLTGRMRAAGTDTSTAYYWGMTNSRFNATSSVYGGDNQSSITFGYNTQDAFAMAIDVISPKIAKRTRVLYHAWSADPTPTFSGAMVGSGLQFSDTSFDAMTFLGSANITGFYTVYGYNQ